MNIKDKISTAKERIKELEVMIAAWESTLPKKEFGEKNDVITPTTNGISDVLLSGTLKNYYEKSEDPS